MLVVILDGASVNACAVKELELLYPNIVFIWCGCHVLNLLLQDIGTKCAFVNEHLTVGRTPPKP